MKERPILMSGPLVRAILAGTKTQTRRVVKVPGLKYIGPGQDAYDERDPYNYGIEDEYGAYHTLGHRCSIPCPYGQPGDRLIVKEAAWMWCERRPNGKTPTGRAKWLYVPLRSAPVLYCADHPERPDTSVVSPETGNAWAWRKKLGRFLPKWASRLTLAVESIRVERLNDISEEDARAEGVEPLTSIGADQRLPGDLDRGMDRTQGTHPHTIAFASLWDRLNRDRGFGWDTNCWVWVITFSRAEVRS